jgi:tRNA-splicing ligase RtcB (3'-phosphate/5'-hydroxy nucleic acid ligase)
MSIRTKELSKIGYTNNQARSMAQMLVSKHMKHLSTKEALEVLIQIRNSPNDFLTNDIYEKLATLFIEKEEKCDFQKFQLRQQSGELTIYGTKEIDTSAKKQMELAMALPISVQGALMPDAHAGYGLPIGAVLATNNAVIPYGVGMDIGCRMSLTIFEENEKYVQRYSQAIKNALLEKTHFGMEGGLAFSQEHEILDSQEFQATPLLKKLQNKASIQLGSSGGGNHFVEFGKIELFENNSLKIPAGIYSSLLSHSGSRGLGASIAQHYTKIAMDTCKLPKEVQSLAWLDMNSEAGTEYWLSMNLAGQYAKACHDQIHYNLMKSLGIKAIANVENHHNFAWKEKLANGQEVIVHRKGATPAMKGTLGIIPGSMGTSGYLVSGNGIAASLQSASHGAGRMASRQKARESMTNSALKKLLIEAGVTLLGGSVEENPMAYKDIERVMFAQKELVTIEGKFTPQIVRMNKE